MIRVTQEEEGVFQVLLRYAPEGTVLRVAGGWVRDKLMGRESDDIDIAINIDAHVFGQILLNAGFKGILKKADAPKGKHVKTAMIDINGFSIDIAGLRTEVYTEGSRKPDVEMTASAEEDAMRRDFTINCMFFNLHTQEIEDFFGGQEDLKNGVIRTPRDPFKTFKDDALRIVRGIRFASRYLFEIHHETREGMAAASLDNTSQERIFTELLGGEDKGWKGIFIDEPELGTRLLWETGVWNKIFATKTELCDWEMEQFNPYHEFNVLDHTLAVVKNLPTNGLSRKERGILVMAACLHDIAKLDPKCQQWKEEGLHRTYHGHEAKSAELAREILNNLKAPRKEFTDRVCKLIELHLRPHQVLNGSDKALRRFKKEAGSDWKLLIRLAEADAMGKRQQPDVDDKVAYVRLMQRVESLGEVKIKLLTGKSLVNLKTSLTALSSGNGLVAIEKDNGSVEQF